VPLIEAKSSIAKWLVVPAPLEAIVSLPGFAFKRAIRSDTDAMVDLGLARSTSGTT
jgi:hypothetical protein